MSMTNGALSLPNTQTADLTKEIAAYDVVIPVANTAQVANPTEPMDAVVVYNTSTVYRVRGTITFTAAINSLTLAAQRTFVVPAGGTYSIDFADRTNDDAVGSVGAIDSISFQALNTPTGSGLSSAAAAPAALGAQVYVQVNFAQG